MSFSLHIDKIVSSIWNNSTEKACTPQTKFWNPHLTPKKALLNTYRAMFSEYIPQWKTLSGEKPNLGEKLLLLLLLLPLLFTESEIERLVLELGGASQVLAVLIGWEGSTSFLERWRPLCMCLSQYFLFGKTSLLHLHFFPSVLLHLPGSGSGSMPILWSQGIGLDPSTEGATKF